MSVLIIGIVTITALVWGIALSLANEADAENGGLFIEVILETRKNERSSRLRLFRRRRAHLLW